MTIDSKNRILLGLTGPMGVGKTTIAKGLSREHNFCVLSFAAPLKEACASLTGLDSTHFTDPEKKEEEISGIDITPRKLMQLMGTDFIREMVHPDFWLWRMKHQLSKFPNSNIVIDDVRFPNEAQLVRDNGGYVLHLSRDFDTISNHTKHSSENPVPKMKQDLTFDCNMDPFEIVSCMNFMYTPNMEGE